MGQRYEGTLVIQTKDSTSPTGNYVLSVLSNQAGEKDIANTKQGYNSMGDIIVGVNKKGYAGQVFSEAEMDSYLTETNVGRILQYLGQAESSGEEVVVPVNPIAVGDTLTTLYFDTSKTPDFFAKLTYTDGIITIINGQTDMILSVVDMNALGAGNGYYIGYGDSTFLYASEDMLDTIGLAKGWNSEYVTDGVFTLPNTETVTEVNQQDVWGAYISKDGQWTSTSISKYTTGVTYQVVNDGATIVFKEIRI